MATPVQHAVVELKPAPDLAWSWGLPARPPTPIRPALTPLKSTPIDFSFISRDLTHICFPTGENGLWWNLPAAEVQYSCGMPTGRRYIQMSCVKPYYYCVWILYRILLNNHPFGCSAVTQRFPRNREVKRGFLVLWEMGNTWREWKVELPRTSCFPFIK